MTSLIDVIFLLLLFFMLTSTFSKFSEVELSAASAGGSAATGQPPLFLKLGPGSLGLNGQEIRLENLITAIEDLSSPAPETPNMLLVSIADDVSAQRLTDLLVVLRSVTGLTISVLGSG
ncbi:MAG: biopolymer transporter ExbD [Pseudomonadota bacterium]